VYLEIRAQTEVQIYDSEITIEKYTAVMEEYLAHGDEQLDAEVSTDLPYDLPLDGTVVGSVTVKFPNIFRSKSADQPPT
jgi:hypothetical protein